VETVPPFGTIRDLAAKHRSLSDPSNVGECSLPLQFFYLPRKSFSRAVIAGIISDASSRFPGLAAKADYPPLNAIPVLEHWESHALPEGEDESNPEDMEGASPW